jgi:iron(III) transport system ATP-binding protein
VTDQTAKPETNTVGPDWGERGTAGASIAAPLIFDDICHDYDTGRAVDHFSLEIASGEIICLLGQSGCGKTTLLRIAAGIERQTSGKIILDGREIAGPGVFLPPEKRHIGLMFQDYALFPHLTILQNVCFGLRDLSKRDSERVAHSVLRRVGLEKYAEQYPHVLSGGEQQRVALARAIVPRPGVLLMDEPFSGLDQRLRANVRSETIALLTETRATCLIVTHDPEEAMQIADRIALMKSGRLVQVGTPKELYRNPVNLFAARFFSPFTEILTTVRSKSVETPLGTFPANGIADSQKAVVGIRPRAVKLTKAKSDIHGRIVQINFLGEVDQISIAVEGLENPLVARVEGGFSGGTGDKVYLKIDNRNLLIFQANAQ